MFRNYDGVLKVDGEIGKKKTYDPASGGFSRGRPRGPPRRSCRVARLSRKEAPTMSDQLRKNLLDPEPILLLNEFETGTLKRQKIAPGVEPSPADSGEGTAPTRERKPASKTSEGEV